MATVEHGVVCKLKRVIMERDHYPRRWGLGPHALTKKKLVQAGQLDKYGQPNENTPSEWLKNQPIYKPGYVLNAFLSELRHLYGITFTF